jgi:hypothetical protein
MLFLIPIQKPSKQPKKKKKKKAANFNKTRITRSQSEETNRRCEVRGILGCEREEKGKVMRGREGGKES